MFAEVVAEIGAEIVHPYDDPRVIAGQATCSRELIDQVDALEVVTAPIEGGDLVSKTCLTLSDLVPRLRVYAVEPEQADDAHRSFMAGRIIADDAPSMVAEELKVTLEDSKWHFIRNHVTAFLTPSESEILQAMELTWKRMKILIEPSSQCRSR